MIAELCPWHQGVGCDDPKCCPGCTCPRDDSPDTFRTPDDGIRVLR